MTAPSKTQAALFQGRVKSTEAGTRLDLWLCTHTPWSRKKIKQFLDNHQVAVNRQEVYMASWSVKAGDPVAVFPEKRERTTFLTILYEDRFLLAINKPPYRSFEEIVGEINAYLKRKSGPHFHPYVGMMHRLDRETSGVLIVTLDKRANSLSEQFRQHHLRKLYWAIVRGAVPFSEKQVTAALKKGSFKGGRRVEIADTGKFSKSTLRVVERYSQASLLEVIPQTGRTHQIRAHLSAMGYPIIGDRVYGEKKTSGLSFPRQALHAYSLQFNHPISGQKMKITAPLPKDMKELLNKLRQ